MQSAQDSSQQQPVQQPSQPAQISVHSGGAEAAPASLAPTEQLQHVQTEVELPQEVEQAGVQKIGDTIELPPVIKNLGVTTSDSSPPQVVTPPLPLVSVPLSDQQIVSGMHAPITSALLWLSAWCVKKLHKSGIVLKIDHGKIERVRDHAV
jgi:hypothetical protein